MCQDANFGSFVTLIIDLLLKKENRHVDVAIIGAGFCGILTAIHLLRAKELQIHIHIINEGRVFGRGVAYNPHTPGLLLNVPNKGMSAFPDDPDHFVSWLVNKFPSNHTDKEKLAFEFSPRKHYGEYLDELWNEAIVNAGGDKVSIHHKRATDVVIAGNRAQVILDDATAISADVVILATGNEHPDFIAGLDASLKDSPLYFADPWKKDCVEKLVSDDDVLIIGNGLTTVDTIIGLRENGFKGIIHTVSPHGYRLKPWQESKAPYNTPQTVNGCDTQLLQLLQNFNKHRKIAARLDQSIYPMVDSIRPNIQSLWVSFNKREQHQFLQNLSSFWDRIRHRLPTQLHYMMEDMRAGDKLFTHSGRVVSAVEFNGKIDVTLNCAGKFKYLKVQRIINCSGPQTNIAHSGNELLKNMAKSGRIAAGPLNLGIKTHPEDHSVISADGKRIPNLFVIGSNLKGTLWESTAVPELRLQAHKLACHIIGQNQGNDKITPIMAKL